MSTELKKQDFLSLFQETKSPESSEPKPSFSDQSVTSSHEKETTFKEPSLPYWYKATTPPNSPQSQDFEKETPVFF